MAWLQKTITQGDTWFLPLSTLNQPCNTFPENPSVFFFSVLLSVQCVLGKVSGSFLPVFILLQLCWPERSFLTIMAYPISRLSCFLCFFQVSVCMYLKNKPVSLFFSCSVISPKFGGKVGKRGKSYEPCSQLWLTWFSSTIIPIPNMRALNLTKDFFPWSVTLFMGEVEQNYINQGLSRPSSG